jgi:hypothetical protein
MRHVMAALALIALAPSLARAQTTLQYKWTQGEALVYRTSLNTESTMSGMPGVGQATLTQKMTQRIKILPAAVAPDGSATLQQTIEAVKVEMQTMMGTLAYDSEHPEAAKGDEGAQALARVFGGMVGATISIGMAPDGSIQRIDGVQRAYDAIAQNLPKDRSAAQMAQTLKSVLSDEAVRAALEQSFPRLPAKPVSAGDSWTGTISLGSASTGRITGTQKMTLKSVGTPEDAAAATIDVALTLEQESAPPVGPSGMTMKLGDSKGQGSILFDVTRGRIVKSSMQTEMPATITAAGPDGRPATMKNTTKTSMTMELVQ